MKQTVFPFLPSRLRPHQINHTGAVKLHVAQCDWSVLGAMHLPKSRVIDWLLSPDMYWRRVEIKSLSGKARICYCPSPELAGVQEVLAIGLFRQNNNIATAFSRGSSIVYNAKLHRHNRSSLVLDIRDAFASIKVKHVYRHLLRQQLTLHTAWVYSRLLTYQGAIRQGSPASPHMFNALMQKFDQTLAQKLGAPLEPIPLASIKVLMSNPLGYAPRPSDTRTVIGSVMYTRYADDLCFSSPFEEFPSVLEDLIKRTVTQLNFKLSNKRRVGRNGTLYLPGICIAQGRIQPSNDIICRAADVPSSADEVRKGYELFFNQFDRSGRRHVRRRLQEHK